MNNVNNLKKIGKVLSVLSGGVILLSGCGIAYDVESSIKNDNNEKFNVSSDEITFGKKVNAEVIEDEIIFDDDTLGISNVKSDVDVIDANDVVTYDFNKSLNVDSVEFNSSAYLSNVIGKIGTYSYVDTYYNYNICDGDTLDSIAIALSTTKSKLMDINNLKTEDLTGINVLKYPVKEEYINLASGTNLREASEVSGVDINVISELNGISANNNIVNDSSILLHVFNGDDNRYMSNNGWVNVIYNNRIIGDKVVYASGFAGASNDVLVLSSLHDEADTNVVLYYSFDDNYNYDIKVICLNAKDIDLVNGIPVAYFRDINDIIEISEKNNQVINDDFIIKAQSTNVASYQLNHNQNNDSYVTYNDMLIEDNDINGNLPYSYHTDSTGKYVYLDTFASYCTNDNDTILGICNKFNMDLDKFAELNPGVTKVGIGVEIYYPIKVEFYAATEGEDIRSIAVLNGIDYDDIKNYSSDGIHVDNTRLIHLHAFYNNETSYDTNIGVSNVVRNNKIFGNEFVYASGYAGASNDLLVLNEQKFVSGTNQVTYYSFYGSDDYVKTPVCLNASSIGSIDGIPVAYVRSDEDICEIAASMGLTVDDGLLMQLSTSYNNDVFVGTDLEGHKFVTYDEKILFSDKVTIENNVKTK